MIVGLGWTKICNAPDSVIWGSPLVPGVALGIELGRAVCKAKYLFPCTLYSSAHPWYSGPKIFFLREEKKRSLARKKSKRINNENEREKGHITEHSGWGRNLGHSQ